MASRRSLQAVKRAKRSIDIVIFRFDRAGAREGARGRGRRAASTVRALIAHTNRGGEKNLRKLELRLLGVRRHRGADRRRPDALSRQDDDRRRHAARAGIQLHRLDIERSRSFGVVTRDKRLVKEASSALRGRLHPAAVYAMATTASWSVPRVLAQAADRVSSAARRQQAADLRRRGCQRSDDARVLLAGAGQGRRRDSHHRQGREGDCRRSRRGSSPSCGCTCAAIIRDGASALRRQPEPAQAGTGRPARGRRHRQQSPRAAKKTAGRLRVRLGRQRSRPPPRNGEAADAEERYSGFRRSMTPESMTVPRREMALK